jgi:hypothetical protein
MKKLLMPALGAAFLIGAPEFAAAQLMVPGQPGWTTGNRTLPPGSPGLSPSNMMSPSPFTQPPLPPVTRAPFIGERGDLNRAEPEFTTPGERDASGKIGPTADRQAARFSGERGPDGKLLPSYLPDQRAQAPQPAQQSAPQSDDRMRSGQSPSTPQMQREPTRRPGSGDTSPSGAQSGQMAPPAINQSQGTGTTQQPPASQSQMGQTGTTQQRRTTQPSGDRMQSTRSGGVGQQEMSETAALNALSAEGFTNIGRIERVGGNLQTTAMKNGRQVTVSVDPQTSRITER